MDTLISIIVPCYNYGRFLDEALESIAAQTYANWECIIIDDGSTDNSMEVASKFGVDPRFKYVYQSNEGLSSARNAGIRLAKGDWIHFMDADDVIHFQKFQIMIDHAVLNPSAGVVFTDYAYFGGNDSQQEHAQINESVEEIQIRTEIISSAEACLKFVKGNILATNGPMISSSFIKETGFFDPSVPGLEDWDYWFRLTIKGAIFLHVISPVPLSWMRRHGNNMSKKYDVMLTSYMELVRRMKDSLERSGQSTKLPHKQLFYSTLRRDSKFYPGSIILEEIQERKFWKGLRWATAAVVRSPSHFMWYLEHGLHSIKVRLTR